MLKQFEKQGRGIRAAVVGATGGIGGALVNRLLAMESVELVYCLSRSGAVPADDRAVGIEMDVTDEASIEVAAARMGGDGQLDLVIMASGILHGEGFGPEKDWRQLDTSAMARLFAVNAIGPALVMARFAELLPRKGNSVIASLSARVGSISDNRLGGWYSYRASKAALNQIIKTFSIELARKRKDAIVLGLHPGTVVTELSEPFQNNAHERFSPDRCAGYLIDVIGKASMENSGQVLDWAGKRVPE